MLETYDDIITSAANFIVMVGFSEQNKKRILKCCKLLLTISLECQKGNCNVLLFTCKQQLLKKSDSLNGKNKRIGSLVTYAVISSICVRIQPANPNELVRSHFILNLNYSLLFALI